MVFYIYSLHLELALVARYIMIEIVVEVTINVSVLALFGYKLRQQTILINSFDATLNHAQINLIKVMTKHTLLGSILIMFNPSFYIAGLIDIYTTTNGSGSTLGFYLVYTFRTLEMIIYCVVLYLNFTFNRTLYDALCGKCDGLCFNLCMRSAQTAAVNFTDKANVDRMKFGYVQLEDNH